VKLIVGIVETPPPAPVTAIAPTPIDAVAVAEPPGIETVGTDV
jgi:hypothetical protein